MPSPSCRAPPPRANCWCGARWNICRACRARREQRRPATRSGDRLRTCRGGAGFSGRVESGQCGNFAGEFPEVGGDSGAIAGARSVGPSVAPRLPAGVERTGRSRTGAAGIFRRREETARKSVAAAEAEVRAAPADLFAIGKLVGGGWGAGGHVHRPAAICASHSPAAESRGIGPQGGGVEAGRCGSGA